MLAQNQSKFHRHKLGRPNLAAELQILGYSCEEFESQNETSKFSFWVTKELSLFQKNMFFNMSKSLGGKTFDEIPDEAQGLMMELFFDDSVSKQKGQMRVTAIEPIENKIIISDYQILSFGQ